MENLIIYLRELPNYIWVCLGMVILFGIVFLETYLAEKKRNNWQKYGMKDPLRKTKKRRW